jgi:hypothetical protein
MAKELPYFRFTVQEWQNGDISMESYELKGLFIDVCGFYWMKDCIVKKELLFKRFSNAIAMLEQLLSNEIIKVDSDNNICIEFLNEQFDLLSENRKKRQLAGQKGGLSKSSNATAMLQQNSSYKDKDKDNNKDNDKYKENEHLYTASQSIELFNLNGLKGNFLSKMSHIHSLNILVVTDQLNKWIETNEDQNFKSEKHLQNSFNNWLRNYKPEKKAIPKKFESKIDWDEIKKEMS